MSNNAQEWPMEHSVRLLLDQEALYAECAAATIEIVQFLRELDGQPIEGICLLITLADGQSRTIGAGHIEDMMTVVLARLREAPLEGAAAQP